MQKHSLGPIQGPGRRGDQVMRRTIKVQGSSKDGNITWDAIELPALRIVCPRCDGDGKHVNPSIDGNGITAEEMEELGDDFREGYFSGRYDIRCECCNGEKVIDIIDEKECRRKGAPISIQKGWKRHLNWSRQEAAYQAECKSERRFGA